MKFGLGKTHDLLAALGNPHRAFDVVHVGGTNGKGSVSALVASVLRRRGHKVGLYTSPHLVRFAERIQIDGAPASDDQLMHWAEAVVPEVEARAATFFEAATVLAFHAFAHSLVDIAVVEVGLGGRLDSTNVVDPLVTTITNIGLDHAHYLGDTLEAIAREKAGIIKPGTPIVSGVPAGPILDVIRGVAEQRGAPFVHASDADKLWWETDAQATRVGVSTRAWGDLDIEFALAGAHQALNGVVALKTLEQLPDAYRPTADEVRGGLAAAVWPGRFERRHIDGRFWLFDVAHNVPGVEALLESAANIGLDRPWIAVMGVQNDKDWIPMTAEVAGAVQTLILTVPPSSSVSRRWDPEDAARYVRDSVNGGDDLEVLVLPDLTDALDRAAALAGNSPQATILVTGSCHTVGDAYLTLGIEPFAEADSA